MARTKAASRIERDIEPHAGTTSFPAQAVVSPEEAELLQIYRSLNDGHQVAMLTMARGLNGAKR